jgi:prepilin peptidase CpaA
MGVAAQAALLALSALAGGADLWRGRIPNAVTYPAAALGMVLAGLESGWSGLGLSLLGIAAALAAGLPLFLWGGMGGGDVKLYAAVGALAGPRGLLQVVVGSLVLGALAAVVLLARRGELCRSLWSIAVFFATAVTPRVKVVWPQGGPRLRFGACIALAALGLLWPI